MKTSQEVHAMSGWLSDPGSFMQRLSQHGVTDARINVLSEDWQIAASEEQAQLTALAEDPAWVREVLICSGDTVWMYARTVIPRQTLMGELTQLLDLQDRSLGSVLFQYPDLIRTPFEYFSVKPDDQWIQRIRNHISLPTEELPARRSQFIIQQKSILLTEVFFPDVAKL